MVGSEERCGKEDERKLGSIVKDMRMKYTCIFDMAYNFDAKLGYILKLNVYYMLAVR